jgi:hypothetical protein
MGPQPECTPDADHRRLGDAGVLASEGVEVPQANPRPGRRARRRIGSCHREGNEPAVVATPDLRGAGTHTPRPQRAAGNAEIAAALGDIRVQRQGRTVFVGPVGFNHDRLSIPVPSGATPQPPTSSSANLPLTPTNTRSTDRQAHPTGTALARYRRQPSWRPWLRPLAKSAAQLLSSWWRRPKWATDRFWGESVEIDDDVRRIERLHRQAKVSQQVAEGVLPENQG